MERTTGIFILALALVGCSQTKPELHRAAEVGDTARLETLLAEGRNPDARYDEPDTLEAAGIHDETALMLAAEAREFEAVKVLVSHGANLYAEAYDPAWPEWRLSVFDYAVEGGDPRIVSFLWERSDRRYFAQHAKEHLLSAYRRLCWRSTDSDPRQLTYFLIDQVAGKELAGELLWRMSDSERCREEIKNLISYGIKPNSAAMVTAAEAGLTDIVDLYAKEGVDVNAMAGSPLTDVTRPLGAAASGWQLETVRYLLAAGADPNLRDIDDATPLIAMVVRRSCSGLDKVCEQRFAIVRLLLEHGADAALVDKRGRTARDYIMLHREDPYGSEMIRLLDAAKIGGQR